MQHHTARWFVSLTLLAFLARDVSAQTRVKELAGGVAGDWFGWSIAAVGDVDGDAVEDFAIGAPLADDNGTDSGRVLVYSGRTSTVVRTWAGLGAHDYFGWSLAGAGDVDGDGFSDVLVGAPESHTLYEWFPSVVGAGYAQLISGQSGVVIHHVAGPTSDSALGASVTGGFDLDGDSVPDLLLGAPQLPTSTYGNGYAFLISGATGGTLRQHTGAFSFGAACCFIGDVDADGTTDYAIGAPHAYLANEWGEIEVRSGASGSTLWTKHGSIFGEQFGWSLAPIADLNGNGKPDLLAHSHGDGCWPSWNCGMAVRALDGASGATIHVHGDTPPTMMGLALGQALADLGDLDGDGVHDYAGSGPQAEFSGFGSGAEETRVWSGASGALLGDLLPPIYDMGFGISLAHVDGNGDGLTDILIGDPTDDVAGVDSGRVHVYSFVRTPTTYCKSKPNSLGCTPFVQSFGTPSVSSGQPFRIKAFQVVNNKNGLLFYSFVPQSTPFQGGRLCVKLPITRCNVLNSAGNPPPNDCSGSFSYDFNDRIRTGVDPLLVAGEEVFAQYWSRDPSDPFTTSLTDALAFYIEP